MNLTTIQIIAALLAAIAFEFAFIAAGAAVAFWLLAILAGAGLLWLGWRAVRHRFSHTRDRTA